MVGTLTALQLKLFFRSIKSNVGKIIGLVIGGLYLLGAVLAALAGEAALRSASLGLRGAAITIAFATITLIWPLVTLLVSGVDQTLDPGRFALLPVKAKQLMPGLLVSSFTTLGGFATAVVGLGTLISWSASPLSFVAAIPAAVLGCCLCVLAARALAAVFSSAITTRKFRDLAAVALGVVALSFGVGIQFITRELGQNPAQMVDRAEPLGHLIGWTPMGWAWSVPWEVGRGEWLAAAAKLVLAGLMAFGLWMVWQRSLDKSMVSPLESGGDGTKVKQSSWVDRVVPAGPAGAVAARSLRYWRRDPRHLLLLVSMVAMPFLLAAPVLINGDALQAAGMGGDGAGLLVYPVLALLLLTSLTVAGEINYDGSALWSQISAGVTGRQDRWGRLVALSVLLVPIAAVLVIAFLALSSMWSSTPAMVGAAAISIGAGYGVGSIAGALWQWPTPPPGQNAFAKSSGGGMVALLSTFVCMLGSAILAAPVLALALMSGDDPAKGWIALALGVVAGPLLTWLGVVVGGKILDKNWPAVLARISRENA